MVLWQFLLKIGNLLKFAFLNVINVILGKAKFYNGFPANWFRPSKKSVLLISQKIFLPHSNLVIFREKTFANLGEFVGARVLQSQLR